MTGTPTELTRYLGDNDRWPYSSPFTSFHEWRTAAYNPIIEIDPSNGLDEIYRHTVDASGADSGSVTESNGSIRLATGTDSNVFRRLRTKERIRYQPGLEGMAGGGQRVPVAPTGDQEWYVEMGDGTDGLRFGADSTGLYVQLISFSTAEAKVYQDDWNVDPLNGDGRSGLTLDATKTFVVRWPFGHYGAGPNTIDVFMMGDFGQPQLCTVHVFPQLAGQLTFSTPRLPVRHYVTNGTTGEDFELFVAGVHAGVYGNWEPNRRTTPQLFDTVSVTAGTEQYIGAFRKKSARKFLTRSVKIGSFGGTTDRQGAFKVYLGSTLDSGAAYGDLDEVPAAQTAMELDTSAGGFSGGTLLRAVPIGSASGQASNSSPGVLQLGVDIPEDEIVVVSFENTSGNNADVELYIEFEEEA